MFLNRRLFNLVATTVAVAALGAASAGHALAGDTTCWGGSIASGDYSNLSIAGPCTIESGLVTVEHNLTVLPGGSLNAAYAGSNVTVDGNVDVQTNGILILGCEPNFFPCLNDQVGNTLSTKDTIGGNLTGDNALTVLVHHAAIGHNVTLSGGGGGVGCSPVPLFENAPYLGTQLDHAPPYGDFEDLTIGGNLTITGWRSCWLGVLRVTIPHNFDFNSNVNADPDGNEVATNSIVGNFNCAGNSPAPQIGDSGVP